MMSTEVDARQLAQATAQAMFARGAASRKLGMRVVEVSPGQAVLEMQVRADMLNAHGICHGGFIFALADSALAFAAHSYNIKAVTSGSTIDYLTPAHLYETLTAVAIERSRSGKMGMFDVSISSSDGTRVALFRGKSHQIQGEVLASFANPLTHTN